METLQQDSITFGKYKGRKISDMLRDRKYCKWFINQEELCRKYEYIYNRVCEYIPRDIFIEKPTYVIEENKNAPIEDFTKHYHFFNLFPPENVKTELSKVEQQCYIYYRNVVLSLREKILQGYTYDIKGPRSWKKDFERKHPDLSREHLEEFLKTYEFPSIALILQDIKEMGGIIYKGAQAFNIAKKNSLKQEVFWEVILKDKYGENIGTQFTYRKCIFDFINIESKILYECKLRIKYFDEPQFNKYLITLGHYNIIYLIEENCVINMEENTIYTTRPDYYTTLLSNIPFLKNINNLHKMIEDFSVVGVENISEGL